MLSNVCLFMIMNWLSEDESTKMERGVGGGGGGGVVGRWFEAKLFGLLFVPEWFCL